MKYLVGAVVLVLGFIFFQNYKTRAKEVKKLSPQEYAVIVNKATEPPFSGQYVNHKKDGTYVCKRCQTPLFISKAKFDSRSGWPSFDDAIKGAVKEIPDADGRRIEIVCAKCGGHLGHIFRGEGFTKKNARYCVNSLSLGFEDNANKKISTSHSKLARAYFAGGCFWGVEYYLERILGVKEVVSGFMGGKTVNPSYQDVVYKETGHLETVEVLYDPQKVNYETIAKTFFEIHDPTQVNGQGPDIGSQYLSAVFVSDKEERQIIESLVKKLEKKGLKIATKVLEKMPFYKAEDYHQNYYKRKGGKPYCHARVKRFDD